MNINLVLDLVLNLMFSLIW